MPHGIPVLFWDVDTQIDFMRPEGKLYVPEAETLEHNLKILNRLAHEHHIPIVASADSTRLVRASSLARCRPTERDR